MGNSCRYLALILCLAACQPRGRYGLPVPKTPPPAGHAVLETVNPGTSQVILRQVVLHDGQGGQVRDGLEESFWPDGGTRSERGFAREQPKGLWRSWWPNGVLRSEQRHRLDGSPSRLSFYRRDASLEAEGESMGLGQRTGDWRFYRPDGSLEKSGPYVGGQPHGHWVHRDRSGRVTAEGRYEHGQRVGHWSMGPGE